MINTLIFAMFLITENLAILALLKDSTTVRTLKDYFTYDHGFLLAVNIMQIAIFAIMTIMIHVLNVMT